MTAHSEYVLDQERGGENERRRLALVESYQDPPTRRQLEALGLELARVPAGPRLRVQRAERVDGVGARRRLMGEASQVGAALMRMAIDWARERWGSPAKIRPSAAASARIDRPRDRAPGHRRPPARGGASAGAAGPPARGATAYVTLEPCGWRTSGATSCAELLVRAGVARVVVAADDPSQASQGLRRLRAVGTRVEVGLLATSAEALQSGHPTQPA